MDRRAFVLALSALTASRPLEAPEPPERPQATPEWRRINLDDARRVRTDGFGTIERFSFVTSPLLR